MNVLSGILKPAEPGGVAVDPATPAEDRLREDDEFFKKWSGPIIIGAYVPALFAFLTVVFGTITVGAAKGQCGYPLRCK